MAERLLVLEKERLTYEGVFEIKALFQMILQWGADKGYPVIQKSYTETLKPEGKYITMDLEPFKKFTDYAKSVIKVRAQFQEVKDIVVERDGKKQKVQEGKILFIFDGILETDYESRWEMKPVYYILRTIFEKYVYTPFISGFEQDVKRDALGLKNAVKSFLNLSNFIS